MEDFTIGVMMLKSRIEVEQRLHNENDVFVIEVLRWVLDGGCSFCEHKERVDYERDISSDETTADFLEAKHGWQEGTVMTHMDSHVTYDPAEAERVEQARQQSIDTLETAEKLVRRIEGYLNAVP